MKINSSMIELERRESMMSSKSDIEESEFDADAIVVPPPSEDVLDAQKPRLKGKKCTVMPPRNLDSDLSGLCSIMWSDTCENAWYAARTRAYVQTIHSELVHFDACQDALYQVVHS